MWAKVVAGRAKAALRSAEGMRAGMIVVLLLICERLNGSCMLEMSGVCLARERSSVGLLTSGSEPSSRGSSWVGLDKRFTYRRSCETLHLIIERVSPFRLRGHVVNSIIA